MSEMLSLVPSLITWGALTLAANLGMTVFGFGDQIKLLHKEKNSTSVSLRKYILLLFALVTCLAHFAFEQLDVFIAIPAIVQFVYASVITVQVVYYRKYPGGRQPASARLAA